MLNAEKTVPVIAIAGNPNVGKSTLFNQLTGMHQHTGNWPGKTVSDARGFCRVGESAYQLVDIPGTYSLMAHSAEEEVARNFLCFGGADGVVVVCDATCLERNLNLVLQTLEITRRAVVCVNLLDEAHRKRIRVDLKGLSRELGVPVVGTVARRKKDLRRLTEQFEPLTRGQEQNPLQVDYCPELEAAVQELEPLLREKELPVSPRWLSLKLLEGDEGLLAEMERQWGLSLEADDPLQTALKGARAQLAEGGIGPEEIRDCMVCRLVSTAEAISRRVVRYPSKEVPFDRQLDRWITGRYTAFPLMLLLLALIFWLTVAGANLPSELLGKGLFRLQDRLSEGILALGAPLWLHDALVLGVYRVLAWVVSVMLPPMAIFFPLFTLLEDSGLLPRFAYNLDRPFQCCNACGKQALTMCMGFGCNAVGVTGCRIIDSPRERLMAVLTNAFVPCNGRFPVLIAVITMFFIGGGGIWGSLGSALMLTGVILLGVGATFLASKLLSVTVLKGAPSAFTLELPPYRAPQWGKVLLRSLLDRTLFVLGRAAAVAAPAGLLIWVMANITVGDASLLAHCAGFLDPFGRLLGLDGVILMGFILGLPANEIVIPIIIMAYLSQGTLVELSLPAMKELFLSQGWTWVTAVSVLLFTLFHWPCSTTLLTVKKETGSWGWAALAFALPTAFGVITCFLFNLIAKAGAL